MNNINFQQTGGFPFETDTLNAIQTSYSIFNALGELAGNKTILKGCALTGNTVSDGVIYLNGEVLAFRGGLQQTNIIIREDVISDEFENGDLKVVYHERYAKFGTGADAIDWSEFKRIDPMIVVMQRLAELEKKTAIFQNGGGMFFWNKPLNEIPEGYQEVVDWRGRMPVGLDTSQVEFDALGKIGGSKDVTLTEAQMPTHRHTGTTTENGNHRHSGHVTQASGNWKGGGANSAPNSTSSPGNVSYSGWHSHSLNMSYEGGGQAHSNLSPYRVVLFIEYID